MQQEHSKEIIYHHANTVEISLFHVLYWLENEMCSLARTVAPSSIVKQGKMQDGGGGEREEVGAERLGVL